MTHFHMDYGSVSTNSENRSAFSDNMATFRHVALTAVFLIAIIVNIVYAGSLRPTFFQGNDSQCHSKQFRCECGQCVDYNKVCNGLIDCADNTDEAYCQTSRPCPSYKSFRCHLFSSYYMCIPYSWKCDGWEDCPKGEDEADCAERLAQNWIHRQRTEDQPLRKWGSDAARIAVALYLSNDTRFFGNETIRDEMAYELSLGLLSKLALKSIEDVSSSELASCINSFLVTCINPKKFYVVDLVDELRKRVDTQNYTNPYAILALCNAGERITVGDVEKLTDVFSKPHREFWTDTQALAVLALVCAAEQPYGVFDSDEIGNFTMELKRRQYQNGTVENLKTTALVMQALLASEREADEDNFDRQKALQQILQSQLEDGSFGNLINTYYVLPVLANKSLVNISSSHCQTPLVEEKEVYEDLLNQVGEKWSVQFSLWVGNNRTVERTLTLNVPANISFYRLMEFASGVDNKYRFEYSMRNGKPYIYSISGVYDDHEKGMFWFLYTMEPGTEEELTPITESPADIVPNNKDHLVFWYKCGPWIQ